MHEDKKFRLLIVTQKVAWLDPNLGFFHKWIKEFAMRCDHVTVVTQLIQGEDLPRDKVSLFSLGKNEGKSKMAQWKEFRRIIKSENYDAVFVHMTPIWVILGLFAWKSPVYLWYEARGGSWKLPTALWIVRKAFSASKAGMPIQTKKSVITGHGIDTELFEPSKTLKPIANLLITVGRITEAKHLPDIIRCFEELPNDMNLQILGEPITTQDIELKANLAKYIEAHGISSRVKFDSTNQVGIFGWLNRASIFLHASTTSLDKAVLEAMACGCIVVSSAEAFKNVLPKECVCTNETMADTVKQILTMPAEKQVALRKALREIIVKQHSLPRLIDLLVSEMKG